MRQSKIVRIVALLFGVIGLVILVASVWPIIEYQLTDAKSYRALLSPLAEEKADFTKASNWFPDIPKDLPKVNSKVSFYTVSIPKLNIQDAVVAIGGEDVSKSLVQYPGTALPGKNGNAVIFGHAI